MASKISNVGVGRSDKPLYRGTGVAKPANPQASMGRPDTTQEGPERKPVVRGGEQPPRSQGMSEGKLPNIG